MPLHLEFHNTAEDFREFNRLRPRVPFLNAIPRKLFVLYFVFLAAIVFFLQLLPSTPASPADVPPQPPATLLSLILPLLPWLILCAFFYFLFRRLRRSHLKIWDRSPLLRLPHALDADDAYLTLSTPYSAGRYAWPAFATYRESPAIFALYLTPFQGLFIPKRAFPTDQALQSFRTLLQTHIGPRTTPAIPTSLPSTPPPLPQAGS